MRVIPPDNTVALHVARPEVTMIAERVDFEREQRVVVGRDLVRDGCGILTANSHII